MTYGTKMKHFEVVSFPWLASYSQRSRILLKNVITERVDGYEFVCKATVGKVVLWKPKGNAFSPFILHKWKHHDPWNQHSLQNTFPAVGDVKILRHKEKASCRISLFWYSKILVLWLNRQAKSMLQFSLGVLES